MRYTTLGRTGLKVSRLGFGCMRLPMNAEGRVERSLAIPMLRRAVDLGVTYFDTAIGYCNGDSQRVLGEAMAGIRDRVVLSTKNHLYEAPAEVWWGRLQESLELLQTDHIDIYNFHGNGWANYERNILGPNGKLKLMERAKAEGKIRHICCSFHDAPESLVKLIETGVFDVVTVQYNMLFRELERGLDRAGELGVGVVVMGPVGGGRLGVPSDRIREITGGAVASTQEAAFRFVLAHPAVSVALSGMSTMGMLEENVRIVSERDPFTAAQIAEIDAEAARTKARLGVPCTACGYCMPCPFGVDIPGNFRVYNEFKQFGLTEHAKAAYRGLSDRASVCAECGSCVAKCPQKIAIPGVLRKVMGDLDASYGEFGSVLAIRSASADALSVQLTTRNLRPEPIRPHVHVELADGCEPDPAVSEFSEVGPFAAASGRLAVRVPDGVGRLTGRTVTTHEQEIRETPVSLPFFIIPRDRIRLHRVTFEPASFGGNAEIAETHGYTVGLKWGDAGVAVELDIRSRMEGLARPGEASGGRVELYVDMRPAELRARNTYEDGVEQFLLSLAVPDYGTKSGRRYGLNMRIERTADGCRVWLDLPFADFVKPEWGQPKTIGLDWMFVPATAEGRECGHPTYGGRQGLWQNPKFFTRAFLV